MQQTKLSAAAGEKTARLEKQEAVRSLVWLKEKEAREEDHARKEGEKARWLANEVR